MIKYSCWLGDFLNGLFSHILPPDGFNRRAGDFTKTPHPFLLATRPSPSLFTIPKPILLPSPDPVPYPARDPIPIPMGNFIFCPCLHWTLMICPHLHDNLFFAHVYIVLGLFALYGLFSLVLGIELNSKTKTTPALPTLPLAPPARCSLCTAVGTSAVSPLPAPTSPKRDRPGT